MLWTKKGILALLILLSSIPSSYADIRIGTVHYNPPYVISLNQGFEIDLIHLLCNQMNEKCHLIPMEFFKLFVALDRHEIELAIDSVDFYTHPNPLNGRYIYSLPYLLSRGQFLILNNSGIKTIQDLPKGSHVGILKERQGFHEGIFYNFLKHKFGTQFKLTLFSELDELILSLDEKKITAAFIDANEANYWVLNGKKKFSLLGEPMQVADGIGIVALPQNAALINHLNKQLHEITKEKKYADLYNIYFGNIADQN